jgi:hypothetical protein
MKPSWAAVPQKRPDLWAFPGPGRRHSSPAGEQVLRNRIDGLTDKAATGVSQWRRALLACAAILSIAVVLSGPVHAAEDDDEESIETKFIKGLFGISNRDSINYRERAPLVVPPNLNRLPAPEANALVNSPAWPKDPEVVERKKRAAVAKNTPRRSVEEDNRALTPAELNVVGPKAGTGQIPTPTGPQDAQTEGWRMMRPNELGTKGSILGGLFKDTSKPEVATFDREPTRADLTQPPPGYRTPSAAHPYGITPRQEQAKPFDLMRRGEGN